MSDFQDTEFHKVDPSFDLLHDYLVSLKHFGRTAAEELQERFGNPGEPPYWRFWFMLPVEDFSSIPTTTIRVKVSGRVKGLEQLVTFEKLQALCVLERFDEKTLATVKELPNLTHLMLYNYAFEDLSPLSVFAKLEHLNISDTGHLRSLEGIQELTNLRTLCLSGVRNLNSLQPLTSSAGLEGLEISAALTGVSYKPQALETLMPIAELRNLKTFALKAVRSLDDDLSFLIHLRNLNRVDLPPREFSVDTMAVAAARFAALRKRWSEPLGYVGNCKKCSSPRAVLIGYRTRDICKECQPGKLESFFKSFQATIEEAQKTYNL